MAKHNNKHNNSQGNNSNNFDSSQMGNLFNMNPNQLAGLLNNIDLNQLSSMLNGMGGSGGNSQTGSGQVSGDRRLELLNAIRPLVDADKSRLLDSIIQIYNISRIMKK